MNNKHLLVIFARNPVLGKVKTRLAAEIGEQQALEIYLRLLEHTHKVADLTNADVEVHYTESIDEFGLLDYFKFKKALQKGENLGLRMHHAISGGLATGYQKVVLIGSDCIELTSEIVDDAFTQLDSHDCVLGPANDGGYYLIGLKIARDFLFEDKPWGTADVLLDTIIDLQNAQMSFSLLPTLNDVDTKKDLDQVRDLIVE